MTVNWLWKKTHLRPAASLHNPATGITLPRTLLVTDKSISDNRRIPCTITRKPSWNAVYSASFRWW